MRSNSKEVSRRDFQKTNLLFWGANSSFKSPMPEGTTIACKAPMSASNKKPPFETPFELVWVTLSIHWRQIWRVAGRESGSPELLGSPWTSPEVPRTSPEVFGDFPGSSLTVELNSNPKLPRKFPKLPRKFPELPRKFRDFPEVSPFLWEA